MTREGAKVIGRMYEAWNRGDMAALMDVFDAEVEVAPNVRARIVVRRAKEPLSQGFSRATRRGGLVIRSGRAARRSRLAYQVTASWIAAPTVYPTANPYSLLNPVQKCQTFYPRLEG